MPPSPAPDTCRLYLVRHAATANNLCRPPRLQGSGLDSELSDQGRRQAQRTAAFLAAMRLDRAYCSPLRRARQTAEIVASPHHLAVDDVPELTEVDIGRWEGRTWAEVQRDDPEAYRRFVNDAGANPYSGGENLTMVCQRALPALERLLAGNPGRTLLVVAHNVVNRVCLAALLGLPLRLYRNIPQDNCGINILEHHAGKTRLVVLNGVFHLEH